MLLQEVKHVSTFGFVGTEWEAYWVQYEQINKKSEVHVEEQGFGFEPKRKRKQISTESCPFVETRTKEQPGDEVQRGVE